jgi:hypothetical protein
MLSFAMFFDSADLLTQPAGEGLFQFQQFKLCVTAVEMVDRLTLVSEWNMPAR